MMMCAPRKLMSMLKNDAEIAVKSIGFREMVGTSLLPHLLPQKLLCWQACFVSTVSRWMRTNFDLDYVDEVVE